MVYHGHNVFQDVSVDTATQVSKDEVLVSREGPIVTLTFNRPEARNAMTWGMYQRLYEVCEEVDADDSIRVLILKGAGGKAFVAGTDISQFTKFKDGEDGIKYEKDGDKRSGRISKVKKPVIAQIEGVCVGGGFGIAAGADIRIGTPDSRFGLPIARTLGNCLSIANIARAVDLIGPAALKDLILTGRLLDARESLALGLVSRVVPDDNLADDVRMTANDLAERAPLTIEVTKAMLARLRDHRRPPPAVDLVERCYGSADFREGVAAFLERRPPRWTGR